MESKAQALGQESQSISPLKSKRSAVDVANFFIEHSGYTNTHLQIQKLTYIAHGHSLALRNKALFKDRVEAWDHGPVIPSIYKTFKKWGLNPIGDTSGPISMQFDSEEFVLLDAVFENYGRYCGYYLSQLTHDEGKGQTPWDKNYIEGGNVVIPDQDTKAYYDRMHAK